MAAADFDENETKQMMLMVDIHHDPLDWIKKENIPAETVPETVNNIVIKKEFIAKEELGPDYFGIEQDEEEHELKQELEDHGEQIVQRTKHHEWFEFELDKQNRERLVLEQKEKKWSEREKQRKEIEKVRAFRSLEEKEKKWSERERVRQEKAKKNEESRSVFIGGVNNYDKYITANYEYFPRHLFCPF